MPIYDYSYETCHRLSEYILVNGEPEPTKCECGGKLKKIMLGTFGFKLIGEGWSKDGYDYEYTKTKAGTADKVKPTYSRKTVDKKIKEIRDSMKPKKEGEE